MNVINSKTLYLVLMISMFAFCGLFHVDSLAAARSSKKLQKVEIWDSASHFWFLSFQGGLDNLEEHEYEFTGEVYGRHGMYRFIIKKELVDSLEAKTEGAIRSARAAIDTLMEAYAEESMKYLEKIDPEYKKHAQEKLVRLTGLNFKTEAEWMHWFKDNKDFLIWSDKDDHLIIEPNLQREKAN